MTSVPKEPAMLLSFVNMKLRDFYFSLDAMCEDLELEREEIERKLETIAYYYSGEKNLFTRKNDAGF